MEIIDTCFFRLKNPARKGITWEITNQCNLMCVHCCVGATNKRQPDELSLKDKISLVRALSAFGQFDFYLTGGEPLLAEDIFPLLQFIIDNGMGLGIATNGTMITEEFASRLHDLGVNMIHVSLDGFSAEIHDAIRGVQGSFEKTVNGIRNLLRVGVPTRVGYVITKSNVQSLPHFVEFVATLGVQRVILATPQPTGRALLNELSDQIEIQEVEKLIRELQVTSSVKLIYRRDNPGRLPLGVCPGATKIFHITMNGDVYPCSWISKLDTSLSMGNVKHHNIAQILASNSRFLEMLSARNSHPLCHLCDLEKSCSRGCPASAVMNEKWAQGVDPLCPKI